MFLFWCNIIFRKTYSKVKKAAVMDKFRGIKIAEDDEDLFLPFQQTVFDPIRTLIRERHLAHYRVDESIQWLPPQVIDLHRHGGIRAHVDHVMNDERNRGRSDAQIVVYFAVASGGGLSE
jgi:hypothetical protein